MSNVPLFALRLAPRRTASLLAATLISTSGAVACSNEHARFCEETTVALCEQCWQCGANDEQASQLCGLEITTDKAGCAVILERACAADDAGYNTESARTCQERVQRLGCETLREQGKPDVCGRLF